VQLNGPNDAELSHLVLVVPPSEGMWYRGL
jgi:hypothetical protein